MTTLPVAWSVLDVYLRAAVRFQRTGRSLDLLALYAADLTTPFGKTLVEAIHATNPKLCPDPRALLAPGWSRRPRAPFVVGMMLPAEMIGITSSAGPAFVEAALALRTHRTAHVRLLMAIEEVEVLYLPCGLFTESEGLPS